jgi:lipoyl(octanoyl) transferase
MRPLDVRHLGVITYSDGLALQAELVQQRRAGTIPDTLLLLQHPHVVTVGVKKDGRAHILATPERLESLGVEVFDTGRGGDVTYHGPGQIVAYPILDLNPDRRDVHRYVRDLEEVMIRVCKAYGIDAGRLAGLTGAWITHPTRGPEKVGAIGVRISRWVTSHGLALNVTTDLSFFDLIVPCGIADHGVTSLQRVADRPVELAQVAVQLASELGRVFEREPNHTIAAS